MPLLLFNHADKLSGMFYPVRIKGRGDMFAVEGRLKNGLKVLCGQLESKLEPFMFRYLSAIPGGMKYNVRALYTPREMSLGEFCSYWVPRYFPEVIELLKDDPYPDAYKRGCVQLITNVLGVSESTANDLISHNRELSKTRALLLRNTHILWSMARDFRFSSEYLNRVC